ncbi:DNA polymerase III subunit gamma/tau [Sphingobacterium psychroaquaticum]|uniref:DNA polymerase III subunit gamma/tau n=1 Tax=Sphingobacterium psychroaquaticum TaxID=561061 RepID=A0A1X7IZ07_9SPHI|nr:DNA polymerase III subunit gamma/tau [Sphingobacterium psychroaquaticum]QBQ40268.1 DNA polymerase III subunit gamma/tau [Sphingobacterium psychroaquaticum]SMG20395.1 DNA polymerase-3 subunit gamma/tau [Sphingobacterium psychroaquaticum]
MDNFIVSARKYRPVTFDSVVGQQHITGTLKNAIHNNQLAQAFLFCGPRGVGKTTCARILAKTINCERISEQVEACGECDSCRSFQNGNSFSIHELDAASNNSVDDIRSLIEQVRIPPQTGKYKIYIIDEVHMLSQAAFNAFLKTLEEPPSYAIFILATTEKHKILPTILSRCQIFDFNRIRVEDMANHLASIANKEGITYENDGLHIIAQKADGGLRDALSMFDQIVSFSNKQITYQSVIDNLNILDYDYYFQLLDCIVREDAAQTLLIFDKVLNSGFDGGHFIGGLSTHLRNLLVAKEPATLKLLEVSDTIKKKYLEQAQALSSGLLLSALNIANQCEINYKSSKNQRLQVELALLKMCHIASAIALSKQGSFVPNGATEVKKKLPEQQPVAKPTVSAAAIPAPRPATASFIESPAIKSAPPIATTTPVAEKPVAKKGWGKIESSVVVPNLNTIFEDKITEEETEIDLVEGSEYREVTLNAFLSKWNAFADTLKQTSKITLYTIMTANTPRLNGTLIEVDVENGVQMDELKLGKIDLLNYLRPELSNFALDIQGVQVEVTKSRKPYTSQEKYQAMLAKNPALETLRKAFNLGLS